jgi:hypothetical protein
LTRLFNKTNPDGYFSENPVPFGIAVAPKCGRVSLNLIGLSKVVPGSTGFSIFPKTSAMGRRLRNLLRVQRGLLTPSSRICDVPEAASSWATWTAVPGMR